MNNTNTYITSRCCNQKNFNLFICEGYITSLHRIVNHVKHVDVDSNGNEKVISSMKIGRDCPRTVCVKDSF